MSHSHLFLAAYTDIPPAVSANIVLVNNIDIILSNGSHVWHSMHANKDPQAAASRAPNDRLNNLEVIIVAAPILGSNYTLRVVATSLQAPQPYAIVATSSLVPVNYTFQSIGSREKPDTGLTIVARAVIAAMISIAALLLFYALWFMGFLSFLNFDKWCAFVVGTKKKKKNITRTLSRATSRAGSDPASVCSSGLTCCESLLSICKSRPADRDTPVDSNGVWASVMMLLEGEEDVEEVNLRRLNRVELKEQDGVESLSGLSGSNFSFNEGKGHDGIAQEGDNSEQEWEEVSFGIPTPERMSTPPPVRDEAMERLEMVAMPNGSSGKKGTKRTPRSAAAAAVDTSVAVSNMSTPGVLLGDIPWNATPQSMQMGKNMQSPGGERLQSPRLLVADQLKDGVELPSPIHPTRRVSRQRRGSEGSTVLSAEQRRKVPVQGARWEKEGEEMHRRQSATRSDLERIDNRERDRHKRERLVNESAKNRRRSDSEMSSYMDGHHRSMHHGGSPRSQIEDEAAMQLRVKKTRKRSSKSCGDQIFYY